MSTFLDVFIDVTKYGTKIPSNQYLPNGKYPIIDQGQNAIAGFTNQEEGLFTNVPAIIFGDHTRIIKYVDKPCFLGADGVKLLKAKSKCANYKYLYYVLLNAKIPDTGYNRHFKWLKEINIPLYDEKTQENIVNELDKITDLIDKRKEQLEKLDVLVKARFVEMFGDININDKGWDIEPLGNLCDISRGGSPRPIEQYLGGTIPWIKIGDATKGDNIYLHATKEHIIQEGVRKSRLVKKGSLIFANCGVSLGFARIITFDGCIHDGWLAMENIDNRLDKVFLLQALNQMTEHFRAIAPAGTQPNLNTAIMKAYMQIIPPIELQKDYIAFVEQTDKSKLEVQKSLEKFELLKKALMQKYFG